MKNNFLFSSFLYNTHVAHRACNSINTMANSPVIPCRASLLEEIAVLPVLTISP